MSVEEGWKSLCFDGGDQHSLSASNLVRRYSQGQPRNRLIEQLSGGNAFWLAVESSVAKTYIEMTRAFYLDVDNLLS
jgi:hypothetical protein